MLNKRKLISYLIDIILIILVNTLVIEIFFKILALFIPKIEILFYIIIIFDVIIITLYLLPYILKNNNTLGKKIAIKLIKNKDKKISVKEIILFIILINLLEIVLSRILD